MVQRSSCEAYYWTTKEIVEDFTYGCRYKQAKQALDSTKSVLHGQVDPGSKEELT